MDPSIRAVDAARTALAAPHTVFAFGERRELHSG